MHTETTIETIVRWLVVLGGVGVCIIALTHFRRWQNRVLVVFPVLMASGISITYIHHAPAIFPGAVLYLGAYGYLYWSVWKADKVQLRRTDKKLTRHTDKVN